MSNLDQLATISAVNTETNGYSAVNLSSDLPTIPLAESSNFAPITGDQGASTFNVGHSKANLSSDLPAPPPAKTNILTPITSMGDQRTTTITMHLGTSDSTFMNVGGHIGSFNTINYGGRAPHLFDMLESFVNRNAAYNSIERQDEKASICLRRTREKVLTKIVEWAGNGNGPPVCWLVGPAGSGKSTIAQTIAQRYDKEENGQNSLAFSFFFSRRHRDRGDATKLFPTFAYQLARALPLVQELMLATLMKDPDIPHQRLELQFKKLIEDHALPITKSLSPLIIVIDGLDECGSMDHVRVVVRLLVGALPKLPFRVLFTSRLEAYIEAIFASPSIVNKRIRISLRDYDALDDVYKFLRSSLEEVQRDRNLPLSWPSEANLRTLAEKSESIFTYASTLVKFVGDEYGQPQKRLQNALEAHKGLDSLFEQVLNDAKQYQSFSIVLGAVVVLQGSPDIGVLPQLLQLDSAEDIRLALRGCLSILLIPDSDYDHVRPYHTSLLDFLNDSSRRKNQFFDLVECQEAIVVGCIKLITSHSACDARSLTYAYQYWCHHLHRLLSCGNVVGHLQSILEQGVTVLVEKGLECFTDWMVALEDHMDLERVQDDLQSAFKIIKEQWAQTESLIQGFEQILSNIDKFSYLWKTMFCIVPCPGPYLYCPLPGYPDPDITWKTVCIEVIAEFVTD